MPGFELIGNEEKEAVSKIFDDGGVLFAHGFDSLRSQYNVRDLESELSSYFDVKHTVCVSSGTAALKCALKAAGVKPGDEVITQAFNFIATVEAIIDCGAKPIIVGVDEDLYISMPEIKTACSEKTKAIIIVHMLGCGTDPVEAIKYAHDRGIVVIEDNCEAIGATVAGKKFGSIADIGVISMDQGKTIACGEGGAILTNSQLYYDYCKSYSDHGHALESGVPRGLDRRLMPGFNYRMTEMQGAVARVQLSKINKILSMSQERYNEINLRLNHCLKRQVPSEVVSNYDTLMIKTSTTEIKAKVIACLSKYGLSPKNIPDAMEWHCAYFWGHALDSTQVSRSAHTYELLMKYVAVPILLGKTVETYRELGNDLAEILS